MNFKKALLLTLAIMAFIAGIILIAMMPKTGGKKITLEGLLPRRPVIYLQIKNLEDHIEEVLSTQFIQRLRDIDIEKILEDMGAPAYQLSDIKEKMKSVDMEAVQKLVQVLFNEEVVLALYESDVPMNLQRPALQTIAPNVMGVTRLKGGMAFIDVLLATLANISPDIEETTFSYKKHTVHLLSDPEKIVTIGYTKIGPFLIFGYGDKAARMAIDTIMDEEQGSLAEDENIKVLSSQTPSNAYVDGFVDVHMVLKQIQKQVLMEAAKSENPQTAVFEAKKMFRNQQGFKFLTFAMFPQGKAQEASAHLFYDESAVSAEVKNFLGAIDPTASNPLRFTPQEALVYRWSNGLKMDFIWNRLQLKLVNNAENEEGQLSAGQIIGMLNSGLGFDIKEDLFPLIGDEYGGYVVKIHETPFYPVPLAIFFLKVTDRQRASEFLLDQIESFNIVRVERENYKGTEVFSVRLPVLSDIVPGYTFIDNYLVAGIDKADLFEAIDLMKQEKKGSLAAALIQDAQYGLAQQSNGLTIFQVEKMAAQLHKVIRWWDAWIEAKERTHIATVKGSELRMKGFVERAADLEKTIQETKKVIETLASSDASIDEEMLMKNLEEAQGSYQQKKKFLDHAQKKIDDLKIEEKDLLAVKEDENKKLSPAGEQRLEEIVKSLEKNGERFKELQDEADEARKKQDQYNDEILRMEALKEELEVARRKLSQAESEKSADEEKQKELDASLTELKSQKFISVEKRQTLIKKGMEPLLKALEHWKWFAIKKKLLPGEVYFQCLWEME